MNPPELIRPPCEECKKEIWAIAKVTQTIGVESPIYLHPNCYYLLKRNSDLFQKEINKAVEGLF